MKYTVFKTIPVIKIYLGKQCKNLKKKQKCQGQLGYLVE